METTYGINSRLCVCVCVCVYAHAKSFLLCPALCDPMDCSLPGSSVHGDSPGKNPGVDCHFFLQGIFPSQGSNPLTSPALAGGFFIISSTWEAQEWLRWPQTGMVMVVLLLYSRLNEALTKAHAKACKELTSMALGLWDLARVLFSCHVPRSCLE